MVKKDPFWEARLLSEQKHLTVLEKEAILDAVVDRVRTEQRSFFKRLPTPVRAAALVAVLAVVAVPAALLLAVPEASDEGFAARGGGADAASRFSVRCVDGDDSGRDRCRRGDKLVFRVRPPKTRPYFAAFARKVSDRSVIWYFPVSETDASPSVREVGKGGILSQGVRIGQEHPAGIYEVYGMFFEAPVHRENVRGLFDEHFAVKEGNFTVSNVELTVEEGQ